MSLAAFAASAALTLEEGFKAPPDSAKPHTWYHMMNGNVTKEGITCDFEAIAKAGIGGVQMFDAGCAIPPGPLKFNSDGWFEMFTHAHKEAKRLGLEICIPNCSGWSSSGGPWNPPENGMKVVRFTETAAKGPSRFSGRLPRTAEDNGFYDDIAVLAYPTPKGGAKISNLAEKTFAKRGSVRRDTKPVAKDALVAKDSVIDLTSRMKSDGSLEWDVPAGEWTILRIGYICNGRCNHPASEKGRGLEVDKLSASAMDYHFNQYVARLCKTLGIDPDRIGETGFNNILVDSYEVGMQNWTQNFDKTFEKRMGYPLTCYLPVFAGRIVGSVEETERFLEDFRRVVADLFAENYAGRLTELCHRHGLLCSIEPYGNCPADDLQYGQDVDIPMAEYWSNAFRGAHRSGDIGNSRLAATLAHVWGRRYAATESFTASPARGGRWLTTPYHIKSQGDKVFAAGINRVIYHRFTHQPWPGDKYLPGMTMGRWGMHLDRTQTWWPLAGDWFRYQTRCQWMLQEGEFAADVLFWCGEEVPLEGTDTRLPSGYDYDYCATKAFMALKVENGRVVAPGGVSYALLVLPKTDTMSVACVKKVGELLAAGAKVCSVSRPVRTPGLREWKTGGYKGLVDSVWAQGVIGKNAGAAIASLGIAPDFTTKASDASWIHRRSADADWYFVALDNAAPVKFEASFRQRGRIPEIWDAETGAIRDATAWREENGRTVVSLDYGISGSSFVVFRRKAAAPHVTGVKATVSARPDPVRPEKRHTLVIKKAEYGVFDLERNPPTGSTVVDVTDRLASFVKDGRINVLVNNKLAGRDPLFKAAKKMIVTYVYDGKETTATFNEYSMFKIPADGFTPPPVPDWTWRNGEMIAWQPLTAEVSRSDGTMKAVKAVPPEAVAVSGPWNVSFPAGWGAPERTTFDTLVWWNEHADNGIRYFSGTATYTKRIDCAAARSLVAAGDRVMLDLGVVKNFAEVAVNGVKFPVLWKPPFRVDITDAVKGAETIDLEVKVTNLWPNRLIGDDVLCEDDCEWVGKTLRGVKEIGVKEIPRWVREGKPSPTGRRTFTTWRHWTKEDDLLPSGLAGPVILRGGVVADNAYTIKGPESPKPWEKTAVEELTNYLARRVAGGAKVTVGGSSAVTFHVGDTEFAAKKGLSSKTMEEECWTICTFGGDVVLNGGGYRGCLYAVYHFLEDWCGVRWWSETEEDILDSGDLVLPKMDIKDKPALIYRNLMNSNDPKVSTARIAARRRLNRNFELPIPVSLGGGMYVGPPRHTHACMDYVPYEKYGKEHPEYFAVNSKKKPGDENEFQLCLSNRDVHRVLLEGVLASIKKGTADAKAKGLLPPTLYDLTIFDNSYCCECPKCSTAAEKYGRSGLELKAINWIAGEVAKKHPEVTILLAAYNYLEKGPKGGVKAAPNVGIRFCPLGVNFASSLLSDDAANKKTIANFLSWRGKADNLFVWDYAVTFGRDTLGYPFPNEWYFGEKYRFYASCGLRAIEWEQEWPHLSDLFDLKHYLLSKLSEKPDLDYQALMKRAFSEFFGPKAGSLVYASRKRLLEVQQRGRPYISFMPDLSHFDFITDEDAAFMADLYDRAEKAVAGDARYIRRLKRARSGLDRLMERRRTLFTRGTLDGKRCWMTALPAFGTPHRIKARMVKDDAAPLGKAMEFAKKPGHGSPLLVCFYSNETGTSQFTKHIEIPASTTDYAWFDVGRVKIGQGYHFVMSQSYLGHVYTPQVGEIVGKDFDVKMLAKITDKGQIRIGRMAFIDVDKKGR